MYSFDAGIEIYQAKYVCYTLYEKYACIQWASRVYRESMKIPHSLFRRWFEKCENSYLKWPKSDVELPLVKMSTDTAHHPLMCEYFLCSLILPFYSHTLSFKEFRLSINLSLQFCNCLHADTRSSSSKRFE